jgi:putative tryptophan/tyrosine transport system substrate-binding protein
MVSCSWDLAKALFSELPMPFADCRIPSFVKEGGLLTYGANFPDIFGRAASYVDRILRGANPGDLPVQTPTKYELAVNLKTAKALGLVVPRELLYRADEVIE